MIPFSFYLRMVGCFFFIFLKKPGDVYYYLTVSLIEIGNNMEYITVNSVFSKNLPKHSRATMISAKFLFSTLGILVFAKPFGYLYDKVGYWVPYAIIGATDLMFGMTINVLTMVGKFK